METVFHLDIRDAFRGFGSPALVDGQMVPESLLKRVLAAPGLPRKVGVGVVYDRELAGEEGRAEVRSQYGAGLPGWFALLDCGAVVPERVCGEDGRAAPPFQPEFLPWREIGMLVHDRDREGYLSISGHEIDTSPLSPLQTEILYHGIRYLVSRATGIGFSFGQRRCMQDKRAKPLGLLPIGPRGFEAETVLGGSRGYIRFRARQMGLGPELWQNPT